MKEIRKIVQSSYKKKVSEREQPFSLQTLT